MAALDFACLAKNPFFFVSDMLNLPLIIFPENDDKSMLVYQPGPIGNALQFNYENSNSQLEHIYLDLQQWGLNDPANFSDTDAITLTAWVKVNNMNTFNIIWSGCGPVYFDTFGTSDAGIQLEQ